MDLLGDIVSDGIKDGGKGIVTRCMNQKHWESIFVQAGKTVAGFENYQGDEQGEIRRILFGKDNMLELAKYLRKQDSFGLKGNLENCLDSLFDRSDLSEDNKENCKCHFMDIVMKDLREQFAALIDRSLAQETHDMVAQQGNFLQKYDGKLSQILSFIQSQSVDSKVINYQSENTRQGSGGKRKIREKWVLSRSNSWRYMKFETEPFRAMVRTWKEEREEYPGWYVIPGNVRKELFYKTDCFLGNQLQEFSIDEKMSIVYEFVWRYETGMLSYDMSFQKQVLDVWRQYQSVFYQEESAAQYAEEWFFVGRALLREFREDRNEDSWNEIWGALQKRCTEIENGNLLLQLEKMKYLLSIFQLNKVRVLLSKIRVPKECYDIRLNFAGIDVACGNLDVVEGKLLELLRDLKTEISSAEGKNRVYLSSLYPVVLHLYSFVIQGVAWKTNEYEKNQEKIHSVLDEIGNYTDFFDFNEVKNIVKEALLEWQVKRHERKETFELNRETTTIVGGYTYCYEAYYLYRVLDAASFPLMCNSVNLLREIEIPWLLVLFEYWSPLALHLMLRCSNSDIGEYVLTRSCLARASKEMIERDICYLIHCIEDNLDEMEEQMIQGNYSVCYKLQNNIPLILVRYMSRCPSDLQRDILLLMKKIIEHPNVLLDHRMDRFMYGMMGSISEIIKAEMLGELISTKIVEHKVMHGNVPSVDLFTMYFRKDISKKYCQRTEKIIQAIQYLLSDCNDDRYTWQTKIRRLQVLDQVELLIPEEKKQFIEKLWSRIHPETKLPDMDQWYVSMYLDYEDPESTLPATSVKQYLLDRRLMLTKAKEEGVIISGQGPDYFDEMNVLLERVEKDFWTKEEVELIFQDALDYWDLIKQDIEKNNTEIRTYILEEYKRRIYSIVNMLAELYRCFTGSFSLELRESVRDCIEELGQDDIGAIALQLLFEEDKNLSNLAESITEKFYDTDNMVTVEAMKVATHFVEKYPYHEKTSMILERMIWVLRARKEPGLVSMINLFHNLLYLNSPSITEQIIDQLDQCLWGIEQSTRYLMEDEKIMKHKVLLRKSCAGLAYQIAEKFPEKDGHGISRWEEVCGGEEFAEVKNEMLL